MVASLQDVREWHTYIDEDLRQFWELEGDNARVWKLRTELEIKRVERHMTRSNTHGGRDEVAAYCGSWNVVKKLCTAEFIRYVEESMVTDRVTLAEWSKRARAVRITDQANADYVASGEPEMNALGDLAELFAKRDELIFQAYLKGRGATEIARVAGISRSQVHVIVREREAATLAEIEAAEQAALVAAGSFTDWDDEEII